MKATFFASFSVRGPHQLAARGPALIEHALELHRGNDVFIAVVTVRLDLGGVVRLPAGGPNHGADLEVQHFLLHVQVDGVDLARGLGFFRVGRTDDRGVEHETLRVGHRVRKVRDLGLVQVVVERVRNFGTDGIAAVAAGGAVLVHVAWFDLDGGGVVAGLAGNRGDLGECQHADTLVAPQAPEIDLQAAGWMAQLGKVFIEL